MAGSGERALLAPSKRSNHLGNVAPVGLAAPQARKGREPRADAILADLFRRELETAIMDRTALRPTVVAVYQQATLQAQHLIEDVAARTDTALSQALRPQLRDELGNHRSGR